MSVPGDEAFAGLVRVYRLLDARWVAFDDLWGSAGSSFGASLSFSEWNLAVGAPDHDATETVSRVGQVIVYQLKENEDNHEDGEDIQWQPWITFQGDTAGERFGAAVSMSLDSFVAIGSPGCDSGKGRVQVFRLNPVVQTLQWQLC